MEEKKPLISILMAVYDPPMDWFRQQLESLNAQTYPNLHLFVRDDCSPHVPHEDIAALIRECVTAFPVSIARNEKNLGSNLTFQRLTEEAEGELFAYCDQDDVWLPDKLTRLQAVMEREKALLVCSDMLVIDGEGKQIAESITRIHRHQVFRSGDDLAPGLLTRNFVTGCTMLVDAGSAKAAVPFCPYMIHDQFLALWCASKGRVYSLAEPTIRYRIHGNNQTGVMTGVKDKDSYRTLRIDQSIGKLLWLAERFADDAPLSAEIQRTLQWMQLRREHWDTRAKALPLWSYRDCGKAITLFEEAAVYFPERLFMWCIELARKNVI